MIKHTLRYFAIVTIVLVHFSAHASLIDIRIDLSTQDSSTAGNWNNISSLNDTTSLIDFSGDATSASITGTGWSNFSGDDSGSFPDQDWLVQPATKDGAGVSDGETASFTLSGLGAGTFQIDLVSARSFFDYQNFFTIDGSTATRTYLGTPVQNPWGSTSNGLTPGNWLIWDNVSSGSDITIQLTADSSSLGMLNAIRILEVESIEVSTPTSIVLFGLGLAGILLSRRKKS